MDATFRAGGLASGLDTNSIIEQLIKIESRPIDQLRRRQEGLRTQISTLGDLTSKLSSLKSTAKSLASGGTLATKVESGTATGFNATTGTSATAGSHTVKVNTLAVAAQQRSAAFASSTGAVRGGTLTLGVMGTNYNITIADGAALSDVALAIRQSGAPVSATVVNDGTNFYLSVLNNETGYPLTGVPANALSITENTTGSTGSVLGFSSVQTAVNSQSVVDGLTINRTSNSVSDVIPGVTLSLKALTASAETVVIGNDTTGTSTNITKFVDAYNEALKIVQQQLQTSETTNRGFTLAGDSGLRALQRSLQGLLTSQVGAGTVRALADIGIKTARDGTVSIDSTTLSAAISRNSAAVNELFANATVGLGKVTETMVNQYSNSADGVLVGKRKGLEGTVKKMDDQITTLEARIESRRQGLIADFAAMERIVSNMRSLGNFLNQQSAGSSK